MITKKKVHDDYADKCVYLLPHFILKNDAIYFLKSKSPLIGVKEIDVKLFQYLKKENGTTVDSIKDMFGYDILNKIYFWETLNIVSVIPTYNSLNKKNLKNILVIEPHMDDTVLSIGGLLLNKKYSANITIATVCSSSCYTSYIEKSNIDLLDATLVSQLRKSESSIAAKALNAKHMVLEEKDSFLTDDMSCELGKITLDNIPGYWQKMLSYISFGVHQQEIIRLSKKIHNLIKKQKPNELWFPFGIGFHIDHHWIRNATLLALANNQDIFKTCRIYMYEDIPYSLADPTNCSRIIEAIEDSGGTIEKHAEDITSVYDKKINIIKLFASQWKVNIIKPLVHECAKIKNKDEATLTEKYIQLISLPRMPAHYKMCGDQRSMFRKNYFNWKNGTIPEDKMPSMYKVRKNGTKWLNKILVKQSQCINLLTTTSLEGTSIFFKQISKLLKNTCFHIYKLKQPFEIDENDLFHNIPNVELYKVLKSRDELFSCINEFANTSTIIIDPILCKDSSDLLANSKSGSLLIIEFLGDIMPIIYKYIDEKKINSL